MRYSTLRTLSAVIALLALTSVTLADVIEIKGGRKITGTISRQGDLMVIRGDDGSVTSVPPSDIAHVTLTTNLTPAQAAEAQWTSLSTQIKNADDLQTIISLHEKFLQQFPNLPLSDKVRESLSVYQQLAKGDAVKFRGRWMPRNQIDVTLKQWAEDARPAVTLYRAAQLKEALDAVKALLVKDSQNPDALAVGGLAAYRLNNLALARSYFTSLAASDPTSALAENNLAIVSYQQNASGEGLIHYTKALQAMPDNRLVLDNAAEALNAYSGSKLSTNYRALVRQFEQAEIRMEGEMAKKGLQRWGSTWVTKEQLEQLIKNQHVVQDQMAQLDAQYRAAKNNLASLDAQLAQAQHDCQGFTDTVNYYTGQMILVQQAIDYAVIVAQRDAAQQNLDRAQQWKYKLETQRSQLLAASGDYFASADKLKAALAAAQSQYTGVQRIMDLGEAENPPPPAPVATPAALPPLPPPPLALDPPPQAPPQPSQIIVNVPIPYNVAPSNGRGSH